MYIDLTLKKRKKLENRQREELSLSHPNPILTQNASPNAKESKNRILIIGISPYCYL